MSSLIRINKLLSQLGIASRRKADDLIKKGAITLNGSLLKKVGVLIDTAKDELIVNGRQIALAKREKYLYYMLNKPKGYISTAKDTHERKTVMDLVPESRGIFNIGRLDKDTTGIILLTNDGELCHRLMHPSYEIKKVYEVTISSLINDKDMIALKEGVDIGDKRPSFCNITELKRLKEKTSMLIEIHEGRKRQIRRTFDALGYRVTSLRRISYGGIGLDIKEGDYRKLTEKEVIYLKRQVKLLRGD